LRGEATVSDPAAYNYGGSSRVRAREAACWLIATQSTGGGGGGRLLHVQHLEERINHSHSRGGAGPKKEGKDTPETDASK